MKIKLLILGLIVLTITGCKKFLDADPENLKTVEQMYTDPGYAQGFVTTAYRVIPGYYNNSTVATDDAVSNNLNDGFTQIATGSWTPSNGTFSVWNQSYSALMYINQFLEQSNKVKWANDDEVSKLFNLRMRGEAFGLRGLYLYFLLRNHAGFTPDGQLMGVPIVTKFLEVSSTDFNQPRATFEECVKQIYLDLDSAEFYLPMEYVDIANASQIPAQFATITQNPAVYNRAMGQLHRQLFNGLIAKSFRARTALLAASKAFESPTNTATWEQAANAAAAIIR